MANTVGTTELVADRWQLLADRQPSREAIVHYTGGEATRRWTRADLLGRARLYGARLQAMGIGRGDICAIILRHDPEFYPLYMGIVLIGAIPSVLAYPNPRLHPDKFRDGLNGMARSSGLDWVLTDPDLNELVEPLLSGSGSTIRGAIFPLRDPLDGAASAAMDARPSTSDPSEPCLLQHSSGTTGLQKAVMLSHHSVLEHVRLYGEAIKLSNDDCIVSWLPLYHDMGLIAAFHLPLAAGIPTILLDPFEWVTAPVLFLQACSKESASLAWLPNFAYNLMATRVNEADLEGVRLDSLRLLVNCSEPVRAESHDRFSARFQDYGLSRSVLGASYAMAETTFAVTQTGVGAEARRVTVSREALTQGRATAPVSGDSTRVCVSSGKPISGCQVRVLGADEEPLADGMVGELSIMSTSLFDGYRNNPEATAKVLRDRWYLSGDYGFRLEDEIFVVGRKKDIIIVAGKNIYPEDVEDAVNGVTGVLPGRVVAFGIDDLTSGTERICVVAETSHADEASRKRIKRDIVEAGMRVDVSISDVHLVEPRWLVKSSAGKPSRKANKERVLANLNQNVDAGR